MYDLPLRWIAVMGEYLRLSPSHYKSLQQADPGPLHGEGSERFFNHNNPGEKKCHGNKTSASVPCCFAG